MSTTQLLFQLLSYGDDEFPSLQTRAEEIAHKQGLKTPFIITFKDFTYEPNLNDYDVVISPTNPVVISFNDKFILECFLGHRDKAYFHIRLRESLERIHLMHRVLKHPVPLHTAIALRRETQLVKHRWVKIATPKFPEIHTLLKREHLFYRYTVELTHTITNTQITLSGLDIEELKHEALERLSATVFSDEDLLDTIESLKEFTPESPITELAIGGEDGETRERRKYE